MCGLCHDNKIENVFLLLPKGYKLGYYDEDYIPLTDDERAAGLMGAFDGSWDRYERTSMGYNVDSNKDRNRTEPQVYAKESHSSTNTKNNRFLIKIRPFTKDDISSECPYSSDDTIFNKIIGILIEDIKALSGVSSADIDGKSLILSTVLEEKELKSKMKPFFQNVFCHCRFVSIKAIEEST